MDQFRQRRNSGNGGSGSGSSSNNSSGSNNKRHSFGSPSHNQNICCCDAGNAAQAQNEDKNGQLNFFSAGGGGSSSSSSNNIGIGSASAAAAAAAFVDGKSNNLELDEDEEEEDQDEDDEVEPMAIDTQEDCWTRLHDISVNGSELSYTGRGRSIQDNGLAQANIPLNPVNHYFEIKILEPGENCYIAIGLARKDYPLHKHPGWNRGSIAFHADDGKIFIGSGIGSPFGPKAQVNDVLGCGVVFPLQYADPPKNGDKRWPWEINVCKDSQSGFDSDKEESGVGFSNRIEDILKRHRKLVREDPRFRIYDDRDWCRKNGLEANHFGLSDYSSESEDDIWWNNKNNVYEDKVKVFFTRNSKLLGIKDVRIPVGGFFPTIGMMSSNEKVSVDLHPLSG